MLSEMSVPKRQILDDSMNRGYPKPSDSEKREGGGRQVVGGPAGVSAGRSPRFGGWKGSRGPWHTGERRVSAPVQYTAAAGMVRFMCVFFNTI